MRAFVPAGSSSQWLMGSEAQLMPLRSTTRRSRFRLIVPSIGGSLSLIRCPKGWTIDRIKSVRRAGRVSHRSILNPTFSMT